MTTAEPARRTRLGAYAICVDAADRILLCRIGPGYPGAGVWTLPGGGVEFGEAPDAAVVRELEEETGLRGRIADILGVYSNVFSVPATDATTGEAIHSVGVVYRVAVVGGGEIRTEVDGSTDACGWFGPDDLPDLRLGDLARFGLDAFRAAGPS